MDHDALARHHGGQITATRRSFMMSRQGYQGNRGGAVVIVLAVLAVAAIAFAIYWFALRGGSETARLVSAHIPAEAEIVGGLDLQGLLKSPAFAALGAQSGVSPESVLRDLREAGVPVDAIETVAFGVTMAPLGGPESYVGVATGKFDTATVQAALLAARSQLEGHMPFAIEILESGALVMGSGALFDKARASARAAGDRAHLTALSDLRAALDERATVWAVGAIPEGAGGGELLSGLGGLGGLGGAAANVGNPTHMGFSAELGSDITLRVAVRFDGDVGPLISQAQGFLSMARAFATGPEAEAMKSLNLSSSGKVAIASIRLSPELLKRLTESGGGFPF